MHRYTTFIKFQVDVHAITLLPTKDPLQQVHHVGFMVKDDDVDAIVNLWLKEWCGPPAESLSEGKNPNELPIHQVIGEEHEGDDAQDDPL